MLLNKSWLTSCLADFSILHLHLNESVNVYFLGHAHLIFKAWVQTGGRALLEKSFSANWRIRYDKGILRDLTRQSLILVSTQARCRGIKNLIETILHIEYFKCGSLFTSLNFLVCNHLDHLGLDRIVHIVLLLTVEAGYIIE